MDMVFLIYVGFLMFLGGFGAGFSFCAWGYRP